MKSLFRRSQALRGLGRLDRAASDLQRCVRLEPKNKAFQEALRDLGSSAQEQVGAGLPPSREALGMGRCSWASSRQGSELACLFLSVSDESHDLH